MNTRSGVGAFDDDPRAWAVATALALRLRMPVRALPVTGGYGATGLAVVVARVDERVAPVAQAGVPVLGLLAPGGGEAPWLLALCAALVHPGSEHAVSERTVAGLRALSPETVAFALARRLPA